MLGHRNNIATEMFIFIEEGFDLPMNKFDCLFSSLVFLIDWLNNNKGEDEGLNSLSITILFNLLMLLFGNK